MDQAEINAASVVGAAKEYVRRGWQVTDLRGKQAYRKHWPKKGVDPDKFEPGANVGILPGLSKLTTVDPDSPAARVLVPKYLPDTAKYGRGDVVSRYVYAGAHENREYKDPDGAMVLEIRNESRQDMAPPSVHPDTGQRIEWMSELNPEPVPGDPKKRCNMLATAAIVASRLPEEGRHYFSLHLAGFLLAHLDLSDVETIVEDAWGYQNGDVDAALRNVADTAEKLEAGEPVTGAPRLEEDYPDFAGVTKAIRQWWGWELTPSEKAEEERKERVRQAEEAWPAAQTLACNPDILTETCKALKDDGLVGEDTNAKLLVLSAVSTRHLGEPLSMLGEGTSSSGKSEVIKRVVKTLPEDFYLERQSVSDKALDECCMDRR